MTGTTGLQKLAVVTGASSGIGAATARALAKQGLHVLAGVRRDQDGEAIRAPGIEPVIIDITNLDHVQALAHRVHSDPQQRVLQAVVNNAGISINAPVETFSIEEWRRVFNVNLFGHVAVVQALLPALVRSKGRVVNISSLGGRVAMATYGPYAATKFALEAVSDALRREIAQFGVEVIVVEPGGVRTDMLSRASVAARGMTSGMTREQEERYGALMHAVAAQVAAAPKRSVEPEAVAAVIAEAVTTRSPRTRYPVGRDAKLVARMARLLPDRILDRILSRALQPYLADESR